MDQPIPNLFEPTTTARPFTARDVYISLRSWASQVVNAGYPGIGAPLNSNNASLTITNSIHHVTGTGVVTTLVAPPTASGSIDLISDNGFSIGPGGNIAVTSTSKIVANSTASLIYDSTTKQWYPASVAPSGGVTAAAPPANAVQFNNNGAFGGSGNFVIDPSTFKLTLNNSVKPGLLVGDATGPYIVFPQDWNTSKSQFGAFLNNPGTSSTGSANQGAIVANAQVPASLGAPAQYQKFAVEGIIQTADTNSFPIFGNIVTGVVGYGVVNSASGNAQGGNFIAQINSGQDGALIGVEIDVVNDGTNVSSFSSGFVKFGLLIGAGGGTQPGTAAIMLNGAISAPSAPGFHNGIVAYPANFPALTDNFFNLVGTATLQANGNFTTKGSIGSTLFLASGAAGAASGELFLSGITSGNFGQTVPATITTYAVVWPSAQGGANTFIQNDGAGNLSWAAGLGTGTITSEAAGDLAFYSAATTIAGNSNATLGGANKNQMFLQGTGVQFEAFDTTKGDNYLEANGLQLFAANSQPNQIIFGDDTTYVAHWTISETIGAAHQQGTIIIRDSTNSVTILTITPNGGIQIGAPTGGDKGPGTINVAGNLYVNGTQLTVP